MSKKHPRPLDGDDGSDGTPTERLLREALGARAEQITAHDLRPADPPSRRVRRLRPVYIAAVPLFGLAAAMAFALLGTHGSPVAKRDQAPPAASLTASPSPVVSDTPSAGPSPTASAATTEASPLAPPAGVTDSPTTTSANAGPVPYIFRGVRFKVPAGWTVVPPSSTSTTLCVLSPGAPAGADTAGCAPYGITLTSYGTPEEVGHALWPSSRALDAADASTQPYCSVWGNPHAVGAGDTYKTVGSPVQTRDIVAGEAIRKVQWQTSCNTKESFTTQLWGLEDDQVFIAANGLKPDYQAGLVSILDTLDLSGRQAPVLKPHQNDVAITVEGLGVGQSVPNDGTVVAFSVTYRNSSQTAYASLHPLLFAEYYAGSPGEVVPMTDGTLERLDGTTWKSLGLGVGGGTDYAVQGKDAAFPLAPGQSRTVKYRMKLTSQDGAGVLPVTAQAVLPYDGTQELSVVGARSVPVRVVVK